MGRRQNISPGGQWKIGVIPLVLFMGIASMAVWVIPQNFRGAPVEKMPSSKSNARAGDLILQPGKTSGIILSYSFQPWGGAVFHQPTERLCPRELGGNTAVRERCDPTGLSEPDEIRLKESQIQRIEESLLSRNKNLQLENADVKRHLHRT